MDGVDGHYDGLFRCWGMPSNLCPASSGFDDFQVIHIQRNDCSPACGRNANNLCAICAPTKMGAPLLPSRMKEREHLTRLRIDFSGFRPFVFVTRMAGRTEIFPLSFTTHSFCNDVINDQPSTGNRDSSLAVCAVPKKVMNDGPAQGTRDVGGAHSSSSCISSGAGNVYPRHFKIISAWDFRNVIRRALLPIFSIAIFSSGDK